MAFPDHSWKFVGFEPALLNPAASVSVWGCRNCPAWFTTSNPGRRPPGQVQPSCPEMQVREVMES